MVFQAQIHYAKPSHVAIACGGTGGHLFPGVALAEEFASRGHNVSLLVSADSFVKDAFGATSACEVLTAPRIRIRFPLLTQLCRPFLHSYSMCIHHFRKKPPVACIGMGSINAIPAILAGKRSGAVTFLHEANVTPGRANRFLSPRVHGAFVGFPEAAPQLREKVIETGTPTRKFLRQCDPELAKYQLGLDPERDCVLVIGGSQGAHEINALVTSVLPALSKQLPNLQWIHLTGTSDTGRLKSRYAELGLKAIICSFFDRMDLALSSATVAVSRAGGSVIAEFETMCVPSILVPLMNSSGNHQMENARVFAQAGACHILEPRTPEALVKAIGAAITDRAFRCRMLSALLTRRRTNVAGRIVSLVEQEMERRVSERLSNGAT